MKVPKWLYCSALPLKDRTAIEITSEVKRHSDAFMHENGQLKAWQPQQNLLINIDGYSRKLPPIYCEKLQQSIMRNLKCKHQYMFVGYLVPTIIFLINFLFLGFKIDAIEWSFIFLLMSILYAVEYYCGLNTIRGIKERALFFNWFYNSSLVGKSLLICTLFGIAIGVTQLLLFQYLGNEDEVFKVFGVMYDDLRQHQYWRLITGPLLHYSILHYLNNFLMLSMIGTLCLSLIGYKSVLVFFSGNAIGAYFQFTLGLQHLNNCGGISFGVYSLFGFILGFNFFIRKILPKGFFLSLLVIVLIGFLFSELLIINSASVGHVVGFFFGVFSNLFLFRSAK
ncbi:rhomboid family intramembrane serine protease [Cognaticolwellia beringensis]|uniref:Rhomboid family intramembrane serine protease n=1 Tax=Cognaticolwellia beringensis TaxID=1967665 RepID=A0A222G3N5_9GAMM|nr:rhomboid family intramembrane serine protease [Cognaticolwellia beringensis]ASP46535.1 rhomboid family intramembrane serine protease [Cognaticolwellia beringensis]